MRGPVPSGLPGRPTGPGSRPITRDAGLREGRASAAIGPAACQWSTTGSKETGSDRTRKLTVRAAGRAVRGRRIIQRLLVVRLGGNRVLAPEPRESTGMAADTDWPGSARF